MNFKLQRGPDHPAARLSQQQADGVRERYRQGHASQRALAAELGVHHRTIWRIVTGQSYPEREG